MLKFETNYPYLWGWKEIADHLHISAKTARRLAMEAGLPYMKFPTGKKSYRIIGDPVQIREWIVNNVRMPDGSLPKTRADAEEILRREKGKFRDE